jgi:hypothetical protein
MHGIRQSPDSLGKMVEEVGLKVHSIRVEKQPDHDYFVIGMTAR